MSTLEDLARLEYAIKTDRLPPMKYPMAFEPPASVKPLFSLSVPFVPSAVPSAFPVSAASTIPPGSFAPSVVPSVFPAPSAAAVPFAFSVPTAAAAPSSSSAAAVPFAFSVPSAVTAKEPRKDLQESRPVARPPFTMPTEVKFEIGTASRKPPVVPKPKKRSKDTEEDKWRAFLGISSEEEGITKPKRLDDGDKYYLRKHGLKEAGVLPPTQCVICNETFRKGLYYSDVCEKRHYACGPCWIQWYKHLHARGQKLTCPICKKELPVV